ncbi:hypothetical protein [Antiquaquibacter soli]|uniref:DUF559 domain-containing protein n=1 Tax=Antiquaquibacter soli TaxID=3064523 RepID=A0ABT9BIS4_9MICO|nr:hypothetical protein [Protaetiibacter sp. WY-16]MDO7880922.1 hypothetical protein [Protaetiibacter sp. WY-16]
MITTIHGIRVTSPAATWVDIAAELSLRDLVAVGDHFIFGGRPLTSRAALQDEILARTGQRGVKRARAAWDLLDEGSESRRESHLRVLLVSNGLGQFQSNVWVATSDGHRYRGDLVDPARKIIIEYQSAFHHDPQRQQADMVRRSRLQADGWIVIEVSRRDLDHATDLLDRIRRTLARR